KLFQCSNPGKLFTIATVKSSTPFRASPSSSTISSTRRWKTLETSSSGGVLREQIIKRRTDLMSRVWPLRRIARSYAKHRVKTNSSCGIHLVDHIRHKHKRRRLHSQRFSDATKTLRFFLCAYLCIKVST